jgi:hypothetical protein
MTAPRTDTTPAERWANTPRPFEWVRPRLYRDQAEWLTEQLGIIKDDAFADIEKLRGAGKPEDDPALKEALSDANYAITLTKTIERGIIDMLGPRAETFSETDGRP